MSKNQANIPDVWDIVKETQKMATNHAKLLMEQYKTMRGIYGWPNKALTDMVMEFWPNGTGKFFDAFDIWFGQEMQAFERNINESIDDYAEAIADFRYTAPNTDHYRMLVGEHTKLWMDNYKKLRERREQAARESFDALKKMLPVTVHPILETASKWITEQNERFEDQLLESIKKQVLALDADND